MTVFERRREVPKVTDDEVRAEIDQLRAELDEVKRQLENRLGLLQARLDAYERQDAGIDEEALRRAIDALYVGMLRCGCSSAESEHLCRATLQRLAVVREVAATVH